MNSNEILKLIKDKDVKYVDVRFSDVRGKMQHVQHRRLEGDQ